MEDKIEVLALESTLNSRMNQDSKNPERLSHEIIARRAYEIWLDRGCPVGFDVQNWCDAERGLEDELRETRQSHAERLQLVQQVLQQDND